MKGYSDKLDVLLKKVIEKLVSFKVDPKRYEILKELVGIFRLLVFKQLAFNQYNFTSLLVSLLSD